MNITPIIIVLFLRFLFGYTIAFLSLEIYKKTNIFLALSFYMFALYFYIKLFINKKQKNGIN